MYDIVSIGEILIDLTQSSNSDNYSYSAFPGGAPANLAVAAARLGAHTAFAGKVGNDAFGNSLKKCLSENGVDISGLSTDTVYPTTLAVVSVDNSGERSFSFYRTANADTNLKEADVPEHLTGGAKFFHFGSVSLTMEPEKTTTLVSVKKARENGSIITFDPNYRPALWNSRETALEEIKKGLELSDILKISDEELLLITGTDDLYAGTEVLKKYNIALILVTLGPNGAFYNFKGATGHIEGFKVTVGDTNGAGDTFFGAFLSKMAQYEKPLDISTDELEKNILFANKAASITTSRRGAISAMPSLDEMNEF